MHSTSAAACKFVACILHNMMVQTEETMQMFVSPEETYT